MPTTTTDSGRRGGRLRAATILTLILAGSLLAGCSGGSGSSGSIPPGARPGAGAGGSSTPPPGSTTPPAPPPPSAPPTPPPPSGTVAPRGEGRAVWLSRWHANTEAKVARCVDYMVANELNILLIQTFGSGQALHPSTVAPRSGLTEASGFDPLEAAVRLAAPHGIEVHAWINALQVWSTGAGTPSADHPLRVHPEWAMVSSSGQSMTALYGRTPSTHVFLCPARDEVRRFLRDLSVEIATGYPVDGVHLDYIRYPSGSYCFCSVHTSRFRAVHGRDPRVGDPAFDAWRYDDVTQLVREIKDDLAAASPDAQLSAATFPRLGDKFQDGPRWMREGLLDFVCPMIYTRDDDALRARVRDWSAISGGRDVYAGIMVPFDRVASQIRVAREAGAEGVALFSFPDIMAEPSRQADVAAELGAAPTTPLRRPWRDGTPDDEAPVTSGFEVAGIGSTVAVAALSTDERATVRVEIVELGSLTGASGSTVPAVFPAPGGIIAPSAGSPERAALIAALDAGPTRTVTPIAGAAGFDHVGTITGLRPSAVHALRVIATDLSGNVAVTAPVAFTTTAAGVGLEVEVDDGDPGFATRGSWASGSSAGGRHGDYLFATAGSSARAEWTTFLAEGGDWEVSVWYVAGTNRTGAAAFAVVQNGRTIEAAVDQRRDGRQWRSLGSFPLDPGRVAVTLAGGAPGGVVIADAVRFRKVP